jgi:hypothetical protein
MLAFSCWLLDWVLAVTIIIWEYITEVINSELVIAKGELLCHSERCEESVIF